MDKREEKTIKAIHMAFEKLINEKEYEDITIQDILNESGISRSTFYSHYKAKQELLLSISNHIFEHVFSKTLAEEDTHDFSKDTFFDYQHLVIHIFYHIRDEKNLFKGILSSSGKTLFFNEFKNHLYKFINSYYKNYVYSSDKELPFGLKKAIAVDSFITMIEYWINTDFKETPEQIGEYYIDIFKKV